MIRPSEPEDTEAIARLAVVGVVYWQPRGIGDGVWDLTMIAVEPDRQGAGIGTRLMAHVEEQLRAGGARVLLVDTSSTDQFADTRAFYGVRGYDEEARIRDYWAAGDDLVVFWKAMS